MDYDLDDTEGVVNPEADKVERVNKTWGGGKYGLHQTKFEVNPFERLQCECGCLLFEVLATGDYETTAQCANCKKYYIVHSG